MENHHNDPAFMSSWHEGTLSDAQISELTMDQTERYQLHQQYLKEHKGHESQHEMMALILLFALFSSQFLILYWKKKHYSSYQVISLAGLYVFPTFFALYDGWTRFLIIWTLFSIINGFVIHKASRKPLESMTPRMVYKWYSFLYTVSFAIGLIGYCMMVFVFFGFASFFNAGPGLMDAGVLFLSYGLYFGVLGRDFVEICSDRMASTIGYYSKEGLPQKHLQGDICAVCGQATSLHHRKLATLTSSSTAGKPMFVNDPIHQLACKHVFHEKCIRGWCLVGKKDICPYCKEKVDLKQFKKNPWDTQQQLYLNLLDGVRYLVVWQPIIFGAVQLAYYLFGLD
ncbi:unnamed protein product [Absidia cylindrospora]